MEARKRGDQEVFEGGTAMQPEDDIRPDLELEDLAAQGDKDALAELYSRYHPRLYKYLTRFLGSQDEAADVTQDTFIRVMKALAPKEQRASFSTWLFRIGRNQALNHQQRRGHLQRPLDVGEGEPAGSIADSDPLVNPELASEIHEREDLVWDAASGLGPREYSLFRLHWKEGLGATEIGKIMGMSRGAVDTALSRVRGAMKSLIGCVLMLREGQRRCPELRSLLRTAHAVELSPYVRKLIEGHVGVCETCHDQQRRLMAPANILGLALAPLALVCKKAGAVFPAKFVSPAISGSMVLSAGALVATLVITFPRESGDSNPAEAGDITPPAAAAAVQAPLAPPQESTPTPEPRVQAASAAAGAGAVIEEPAEEYPNGAMAVDCDGRKLGIQTNCSYGLWDPFFLQVHVAQLPDGGYYGFQAKLQRSWSQSGLVLDAPRDPDEEALWPECNIPARLSAPPADETSSLVFGCAPFPSLTAGSSFTGAVLEFEFRCLVGTSAIDLVPRQGDSQLGTHFLGDKGTEIDPQLIGAVVTCGDVGPPCPPAECPEPTPGSMAVDCNGATDGIQTSCTYDTGDQFDVLVHVTDAPSLGYTGLNVKLGWTGTSLDVQLPRRFRDASLLPDCADPMVGEYPGGGERAVEYNCGSIATESGVSFATGPVVHFQFQCREAGDTRLTLLVNERDPTQASNFAGAPGVPQVEPATVNCVGEPPTATPTPSPTAAPTPAPTSPNGAMAVDCDAAGADIQNESDDCTYDVGDSFSIQVHVTGVPDAGYFAFQTKLRWGDAILSYLPTPFPDEEGLWPECDIAARNYQSLRELLFGCVPMPSLAEGSRDAGPIAQFQFLCERAGETQLWLVPRPGDPHTDTHFLNGASEAVDPTLRNATITCRSATK